MSGWATVAICDNPLPGGPVHRARVPAGLRVQDIVPTSTPGAMARVNGQWLLRKDWGLPLQPGEHLDVHILPQGSDSGRKALATVLAIVAVTVLAPGGAAGLAGWQSALAIAAASLAINIVLGPRPDLGLSRQAESPTYSVALSGNQARLYEPIPVLYGRNLTYPPFASQPYVRYDNTTNDQYFYALLCLGVGAFDIERLQIDDTHIDRFADVQYAVLAPGQTPTLVSANVVTAPEVAGQDLKTGRYVGGFAACGPRQLAGAIEVDFVCEGLGDATAGGAIASKTVTLRVQVRTIDDWGVASTTWTTLGEPTITAASSEAVRRTFAYTLTPARRVEVRAVRLDARDANPLVLNDPKWAGLRAVVRSSASIGTVQTLEPTATHVEVKIRATDQLSGLSQRRLAVISRRKVRTWSPGSGWSAVTFTRNPAWHLADKWTNALYGDGLPDDRIDLTTLHALSLVWAERQDHCDIVFDTATDSDSADQVLARTGRARCFWRQGVRTLVRDQAEPLPVAGFSSRDMVPGSTRIDFELDVANLPDGIVVEYWDLRAWDWRSVTCPAPGVASVTRPEYMRLAGVTGAKHAEREGLYEAARRALGRIRATFVTELQGLLPTFGSTVIVAPALSGWGAAGDVVDWDEATLTATLSEPPAWAVSGTHYITLWRDDGTVTEPIVVTQGATDFEVVLATAPDYALVVEDAARERPRYVFSTPAEQAPRVHKVLAARPQPTSEDGVQLVELLTLQDDDAVHLADAALLPGVGEVQDPIDSTTTPGPGGPTAEDYIPEVLYRRQEWLLAGNYGGQATDMYLQLLADGTYTTGGTGAFTGTTNGGWVLGWPWSPAPGALFEVRLQIVSSTNVNVTGATLDAWLSLGSTRRLDFAPAVVNAIFGALCTVRISIRDAATSTLQAEGLCDLTWAAGPSDI